MNINQKYQEVDVNTLTNNKIICLTLDLEQDFGDLLDQPTFNGLEHVSKLVGYLKERNIPITVFIQGSILDSYPKVIDNFSNLDVEFELHSYSHIKYGKTDPKYEIEAGITAYLKYFGRKPRGYRFPSGIFREEDYKIMGTYGFQFDSSVFPSIRPGEFNNLNRPVKPYYLKEYNMMELPFTVFSKFIRIPVSLSYIKLLGRPYLELIKSPLLPEFIIFNIHMHDLFEISSSSLVIEQSNSALNKMIYKKIYRQNNNAGFNLLKELIDLFEKRNYSFMKLGQIYDLLTNNGIKNKNV